MRGLNLSLKDFLVGVSHRWKYDVYNLTKTRSLSLYSFYLPCLHTHCLQVSSSKFQEYE